MSEFSLFITKLLGNFSDFWLSGIMWRAFRDSNRTSSSKFVLNENPHVLFVKIPIWKAICNSIGFESGKIKWGFRLKYTINHNWVYNISWWRAHKHTTVQHSWCHVICWRLLLNFMECVSVPQPLQKRHHFIGLYATSSGISWAWCWVTYFRNLLTCVSFQSESQFP